MRSNLTARFIAAGCLAVALILSGYGDARAQEVTCSHDH